MDSKHEVAYKAYTMSPAGIVGAIEEIVDEETRRLRSQRDELLAACKAVRVRFRQEFAALTDGQYGTADAFSEMQALSYAIARVEADNE